MTPFELFEISSRFHVYQVVQRIYVFWLFIEFARCTFKGAAAVYFVRAFCGSKSEGKFLRPVNISFAALYAIILFIEYFFCGIFLNKWFWLSALPLFALTLIYSWVFCKGSASDKILSAAMANGVILIASALCNLVTNEILGDMYYMLYDAVQGWTVICMSPILIYFAMFVLLRLFHKTDITGKKSIIQWTIVSTALIVTIITAAILFIRYARDSHNIVRLSLFAGTVIVSVILSDIFVFLLLSDILKKNKAVNELNLLKQTEEYNRQYIENLQNEYETVRKMRHDYKNSFLAVLALLDDGEVEKVRQQISESLGAMTETEVFINTDNAVVNAVVNAKLSSAKSLGIECECLVAKDISGIDDIDLCRLLSNMLDNAITACKNDVGVHKRLELSIRRDDISYIFTVKNTVSSSVLEYNPELKSTKKGAGEHGYGVGIIREIAEKYGGRSDFYEDDGMFCCAVYLRKKD